MAVDFGLASVSLMDNVTDQYNVQETTFTGMDEISNLTFSNQTTHHHGNNAGLLRKIADILLPTFMLVLMIGIGATIEVKTLVQNLRRPLGPLVGMICQFVLLPATAFGLAHALQLDDPAAIGMLVIGCCPGGSLSNVATYWVDGDVSLSVTMTSLSTLLAVGMMPLNLWIYSRSWTTGSVVIPYVTIIISLVMIVIPAAIGMFIRWKWERLALKITKLATIFGILLVSVLILSVFLFHVHMFNATWNVYVGGTLLPVLGLVLGYLLAKICRMNNMQARTVSLETSLQNAPLGVVLIKMSFPDKFALIGLVPTIYGISIVFEVIIIVCIYKIYKRLSVGPTTNTYFEPVATAEI